MFKVVSGVLLGFVSGALELMMQVGSHDAAANFCTYLFHYRPSCSKSLDEWAWLLPTALGIAAVVLIAWAPVATILSRALHYNRLIPLNEAASYIYGKLRGTALGRFTEGDTGGAEEILDNIGMQILHNANVQVRRAPSPNWEPFPKSELSKMGVCRGATGIHYWGQNQIFYTDPKISRRDMQRVARHLKKHANFISEWSKSPPKPSEIHPLKISVGTDPSYYELIEYRSLWSLTRLFKLKVENADRAKTVVGCKVVIASIEPQPGYRSPWTLKENFSLAAGDHVFVPLVSYQERREPEKYPENPAICDTFKIHSIGERQPLLGTETEHILHIRCTAIDLPFVDANIRVSVAGGRMKIEVV
jgi:hypothetical protein